MTSNVLMASPRIVDFEHVLRDFNSPVQVRDPQGNTGVTIQRLEKHINFDVLYLTAGGAIAGALSHNFTSEEGELCSVDTLTTNAGVDPVAVWEAAFDAAKELFEITKDPTPGSEKTGIPFYLQLEKVKATLNPKNNMGITFGVGIYRDTEKTQLVNLFELTFVDKKTETQRAATLAAWKTQVETLDLLVAGTHPNQTGMDADKLAESKAQATQEREVKVAQITQHEAALIGPLSAVLGLPTVQQAFYKMTEAAFTEFKAKVSGWEQIVVSDLMALFPAALQQVVEA